MCKKHWTLENGVCSILECETGYSQQTDSNNVTSCVLDELECGTNAVEIDGKCVKCNSACLAGHCTGPEAHECTECKVNGAELSGTPSLCLCPVGTYLDENEQRCVKCNMDCASCNGPRHDQCKTCNSEFARYDDAFHEGVGHCVCMSGYEYAAQFDLCVQTCQEAGTYFLDYYGATREAWCEPCPHGPTCASCAWDAAGMLNCTACASPFKMNDWGEC